MVLVEVSVTLRVMTFNGRIERGYSFVRNERLLIRSTRLRDRDHGA